MLAGVPVEIRSALATDVEALARLAALTFPLACPPGSTPQDQQAFIAAVLSPERFAEYVADPQRVVLVAESDDELVGYTMLVAGEPTDADVRSALTILPTIELSK